MADTSRIIATTTYGQGSGRQGVSEQTAKRTSVEIPGKQFTFETQPETVTRSTTSPGVSTTAGEEKNPQRRTTETRQPNTSRKVVEPYTVTQTQVPGSSTQTGAEDAGISVQFKILIKRFLCAPAK